MPERNQQELIGMAIAATVAAIALGGLILSELHPDASPDADLVTASVLSRAGATSAPSERPVGLVVPKTVPAFP